MTNKLWKARGAAAIAATALIALASPACIDIDGDGWRVPTVPPPPPTGIVGSGNVAQQSRSVTGFSDLDLQGIGHVYVEQGSGETLMVRAEDNLLPYLRTAVVGGVLEISVEPGVNLLPTEPIEYFVTASRLQSARLTGAGNIDCARMSAERMELESTGVGRIEFTNLDLRELDVTMTGVGAVRTTGGVERQWVRHTGVGNYQAKRLRSAEAEVQLHGSGSATVRVSDRLVANVTGSGCVYYLGDPIVESTVTGSGCVEPLDD